MSLAPGTVPGTEEALGTYLLSVNGIEWSMLKGRLFPSQGFLTKCSNDHSVNKFINSTNLHGEPIPF